MNAMSWPIGIERTLRELFTISREFGSNSDYVLAGGGNTSWKNDEIMFVKASGETLANLDRDGIVAMDMKRIDKIWSARYPVGQKEREDAALYDLMNARRLGEEEKRPSVESLLHAFFPFHFVIHTHPALVNGLTCAKKGEKTVRRIFGADATWIPVIEPGYVLAKAVKETIEARLAGGGVFPPMLFLQNHGVFVAADTVEEIRELYRIIFEAINAEISKHPNEVELSIDGSATNKIQEALPGFTILPFATADILNFAASWEAFKSLRLALTPDHIVYFGYRPLYVESWKKLLWNIEEFKRDDENRPPRIIVVKNVGAFSCHENPRKAELAKLLFLDNVKIAIYTESFGGAMFMPDWLIRFIRTWEIETYRASVTK